MRFVAVPLPSPWIALAGTVYPYGLSLCRAWLHVVQIVKFGGSVVTDKHGSPEVRHEVLDRLAEECAGHGDELVLVHGAGSFGHPLAKAHELADGAEGSPEALSQVHANVRELNLAVLEAIRDHAGPCISLSPFGLWSCNDGQPGGFNLVPVHRARQLGQVPVTYGDVVLDTQRGVTVLSGDRIVVELSRFLEPERAIFVLDEDGAYSHPPSSGQAELMTEPELDDVRKARDRAREAGPEDATGGMAGKLDCTLALARAGTDVALVNGNEPGRLGEALDGDVTGTRVPAKEVAR